MNKVFLLGAMFILFAIGGYWFYSSPASDETMLRGSADSSAEVEVKTKEELTTTPVESGKSEADNSNLFDLKSSIQGVIADSVQDEIQEAVEKEMKKSVEAPE